MPDANTSAGGDSHAERAAPITTAVISIDNPALIWKLSGLQRVAESEGEEEDGGEEEAPAE